MTRAVPTHAVEMSGVNKKVNQFQLTDLNLTLAKGEVLGLVGPNGAGKSTTLKMLMGLLKPDSGLIRALGYNIPTEGNLLRSRAAFVSEEMRLFAKLSIAWHMAFFAKLFPTWDDTYATHLLRQFDLKPHTSICDLSLGERVKTTLLLALARRPKLLVLDEPSTGLDPIARYELTEQLFSTMLDEENSVVFSSQFTQDVERISDTIAFLDQGVMVDCKDKESYLNQWRRIEISGSDTLPCIKDMASFQKMGSIYSIIVASHSSDTLNSITDQGFSIHKMTPLTLEEIFIHQVKLYRNSGVRYPYE